MRHYKSGGPVNPGESTGITVELDSREVQQWRNTDWDKIQEVEQCALTHGLRLNKIVYFVKGAGDLMLEQGTIASLKQKYPDMDENGEPRRPEPPTTTADLPAARERPAD